MEVGRQLWCNSTVICRLYQSTLWIGNWFSMGMVEVRPLKTIPIKDADTISTQLSSSLKKQEFSGKKGDFLSRDSNKQGLINLISDGLRKRGCNVINASGDVDVDIVKAAVESSHLHSTTLIGEDTDLFVLLLYHAHAEYKNLYFRSDTKAKATKVYNINRLKVILGNDLCSQCSLFMPSQVVIRPPGFLVLVRRQLSKSL